EEVKMLARTPVDIVLSDLKMPDGDGLELLRALKKNKSNTEVILITGYGTVEAAVEAMKEGAYDFITKPFKKAVILSTIERAIERQSLEQENKYLKAQLGKETVSDEIIGKSQALRDVLDMVERVAPLTSTVLITGASGTGKELIARAVHKNSPRTKKRFIPINCSAIPESLIESELFGHLKGSFTGAFRDKSGLFKAAEGGTIFLDEIISVPLNLQVKLLRAIEQKEILPVGSIHPEIVDVRIVAATNKNLANEVEEGNFREDLYYRLNVVGINIPPLKERVQDIPDLIKHFLKKYNVQLNKQIIEVDEKTLKALMEYPWKGNVRELENAVERAMILCDSDKLTLQHFYQISSENSSSPNLNDDLKSSVKRFEQERILNALKAAGNDKSKAAENLGLSLSSLYRKMSELGIELKN
ncbi:sigma-54-dependent Fis family transcriptional regulator, partial [candidate division KSB1 bacterium]|nr:sigma-54-dependent Fis family transcriptional regulator [candidate division KSB1 bacterium]